MAKIDIEQIKADRKAGTQGPWELRKIDVPCRSSDDREAWEIIGAGGACVTDTQDYYPEPLSEIDIRRVSRLDDLEAALIEAFELLRKVQKEDADFAYDCGIDEFLERFK